MNLVRVKKVLLSSKNTKDVIVALSSTAGTIKSMIDEGLNLALLKINLFRPFPHEEIKNILKDKKPHYNENDIEFIKGYVEYALKIENVNIPKEFEDEIINFIEKIKKNEK